MTSGAAARIEVTGTTPNSAFPRATAGRCLPSWYGHQLGLHLIRYSQTFQQTGEVATAGSFTGVGDRFGALQCVFECFHGPNVERSTACLGRHPHCYPAKRYLAPRLDPSRGDQSLNQVRIDDDEVKRFPGFNLLLYCRIELPLDLDSEPCGLFEPGYESKDGGPDGNCSKKPDFLIHGLT